MYGCVFLWVFLNLTSFLASCGVTISLFIAWCYFLSFSIYGCGVGGTFLRNLPTSPPFFVFFFFFSCDPILIDENTISVFGAWQRNQNYKIIMIIIVVVVFYIWVFNFIIWKRMNLFINIKPTKEKETKKIYIYIGNSASTWKICEPKTKIFLENERKDGVKSNMWTLISCVRNKLFFLSYFAP